MSHMASERNPDRAVDREMARRCWDLDGLAREYAGLLARYEKPPPLTALAALPRDQASRQQVELVTSYRTPPFRDPDLPGELLPEGWPGRRVHEIFIAAHDALHEPADRFVRGIVAQHSPCLRRVGRGHRLTSGSWTYRWYAFSSSAEPGGSM